MSSGTIVVPAVRFLDYISYLTPLFPKGSSTVPIGIDVTGNILTLTCTQGCYFQSTIEISNADNIVKTATVLYCNVTEFVPSVGELYLEFLPFGLKVSGSGFDVVFPHAYSLINKVKFPDVDYETIPTTGYTAGLKYLLNMNLSSIYMSEKPIHIYRDVSVLKYPSMYVQVRTVGLPFYGTVTPEHVKLICRFAGTEVYADNPDYLLFRRNDSYLQVPRKTLSEENTFLRNMEGLSDPVTLDFDKYLERLRVMNKVGKANVNLALHKEGLSTSVSFDNITLTDHINKTDSEVVKAFHLPMAVWLSVVKACGSGYVQILYRSDVVCLRTQYIIILVRVLA